MPRTGNTTARGYGTQHQQARRLIATTLADNGLVRCWRCRGPILTTTHPCQAGCTSANCWDLGHDDHNRNIVRGAEHRHAQPQWRCPGNRARGATLGNQQRARRRTGLTAAARAAARRTRW